MLSKVYEWIRIVHPQPTDEIVEKRKIAAAELVEHLLGQKNYLLLSAYIAGIVNGLESGFAQDSVLVKTITEHIRKHQQAFPDGLAENSLELRACCGIVVGEILNRKDKKTDRHSTVAASLLIAGLGLRQSIKGKYLKERLDELGSLAENVLQEKGKAQRQTESASLDRLEKLAVPDIAAITAVVLPALGKIIEELENRFVVDHEEHQVLWWLFSGFSNVAKKPISDLGIGSVALCSGGELGLLAIIPPVSSIRQMVRRAIKTDREKSDLVPIALNKLCAKWENDALSLLASDEPNFRPVVMSHPQIFPLSWIAFRFKEDQTRSGWEDPFLSKTGIPPKQTAPLTDWGVQIFNESIARRIYLET